MPSESQIDSCESIDHFGDLKHVYKAETLVGAETALDALDEKWGLKYPLVIKSWGGSISMPS